MADVSTFGGESDPGSMAGGSTEYGSNLSFGGNADREPGAGAEVPSAPAPTPRDDGFGAALRRVSPGPNYRAPDPQTSALDQTADMLDQRIQRANQVAANPILQFFNPEGVQKAREFVPAATEMLQKIKQQKAGMAAARQQADTLGLAPGEVADEATQADRVEVARSKALKGDLRVFKGLQAVDPKAAEAIQDQVQEVVAGHLNKAQLAFDSLAGMQNQGQYEAKLAQLRREGTLTDLEALGLKVPGSLDAFNAVKAREGQALREARIGLDGLRTKLEERNTYQPMEEKEAKTYNGRLTTIHGDQITNGQWARNAAAGTRGLIVNGAADPRDLGKKFTLASPEQRKAIGEEMGLAVPKADLEKQRAFDRTYELATKVTTDGVYDDGKGGKVRLKKGDEFPAGSINTNPNIQQGIAEGLASMLRGGTGGANVGLLNIETGKRGVVQGLVDKLKTAYAGGINTLSAAEITPYLTKLTQQQQRDVLDGIKQHNDALLEDRVAPIARRAGALGLDTTAFGYGKDEATGVVASAIEQGRQEQIARMLPNHQAIGGGDGVFQLGAQRPGVGAVQPPQGSAPATTQTPGAPPLQTPVQQGTVPPAGNAPTGTAPAPPPVGPGVGGPPPAGTAPAGGGPAPAPTTIAGQTINTPPLPPGASPQYLAKTQRIESGREKDPWKAGNDKSSAGGAWQFINSTWAADKPPGAPDKARDATPQQQAEAAAVRATKNAAALTKAGVPVNDTSLYIAHNLGEGAGPKLLTADPDADARTVVGEQAAKNNPLFFRGKPTVAKVLVRYETEVNTPEPGGPKPLPGSAGATAEAPGDKPGLMTRISRMLSQGVPGDGAAKDKAVREVGDAAVEHAPAIGGTLGAIGGAAVGGPVGGVAGGGAGGAAGQSFKDYMQGREQNPAAIAKEGALGAVLGVATAARPVASAAARAVGAGTVEGTAKAVEGGDAGEVADAALKGTGAAAGGELFGRALGMAGHKVFNMFAPDAKKAVQGAASKYAEAEATLAKEAPTLPSVNGVAGGKNPVYLKAEAEKLEAERVLKDAGLKPEEAAYAHKVSSEGVPRQEAEVARPGALEKDAVGKGYQQLENEVGASGVGAVKPAPKLADGPRSLVEDKKVSAAHAELAERTEMAITAPAANWQEKWVQLKDARSELLRAERDALSSTAPGRTKIADDMRTLADSVRTQQEKAAKYVFGEKDGTAFIGRLKVLDTRYRNLMEATNDGDLAKAAVMKGDAGREAERKFIAFAHDDPQAVAAYRAMRGAKGDLAEATVPWTVAAEGLPVVGKVVKVAKLAGILKEWARERAAGSPVRFSDMVKSNEGAAGVNQSVRDLTGMTAQRGAAM